MREIDMKLRKGLYVWHKRIKSETSKNTDFDTFRFNLSLNCQLSSLAFLSNWIESSHNNHMKYPACALLADLEDPEQLLDEIEEIKTFWLFDITDMSVAMIMRGEAFDNHHGPYIESNMVVQDLHHGAYEQFGDLLKDLRWLHDTSEDCTNCPPRTNLAANRVRPHLPNVPNTQLSMHLEADMRKKRMCDRLREMIVIEEHSRRAIVEKMRLHSREFERIKWQDVPCRCSSDGAGTYSDSDWQPNCVSRNLNNCEELKFPSQGRTTSLYQEYSRLKAEWISKSDFLAYFKNLVKRIESHGDLGELGHLLHYCNSKELRDRISLKAENFRNKVLSNIGEYCAETRAENDNLMSELKNLGSGMNVAIHTLQRMEAFRCKLTHDIASATGVARLENYDRLLGHVEDLLSKECKRNEGTRVGVEKEFMFKFIAERKNRLVKKSQEAERIQKYETENMKMILATEKAKKERILSWIKDLPTTSTLYR